MSVWKEPETLKQLLWMNSMLGLRVIYKAPEGAIFGTVIRVYDCLWSARVKLDNGEVIHCKPSFVDVKHGLKGVHQGYFFPVEGKWPEVPDSEVCKHCCKDRHIEWEVTYRLNQEDYLCTESSSIRACSDIKCAAEIASNSNLRNTVITLRRVL